MKRISIASGAALLFLSETSLAQQHQACAGPQLGTWKLQSFTTEYLETGQTAEPYGAHPTGYLSYGPDCRMYAIIVRENRKGPAGILPTDAEKIELFGGLLAYAGTYTIDRDKVSHQVDISWNEAWTGTTQVRQFKIEGKALHIRSMPARNPRDGRLSSSTIVWIKVG
jgi:Lipocalin-like domain